MLVTGSSNIAILCFVQNVQIDGRIVKFRFVEDVLYAFDIQAPNATL